MAKCKEQSVKKCIGFILINRYAPNPMPHAICLVSAVTRLWRTEWKLTFCHSGMEVTMKQHNSSSKKKPLDQIDCQMIELLQKDGRVPNTEIAKKLGVSEATVRSRLNRLIEEEYIQIVAVSNPIKLGFKIVGILRIKVDINKIESVTKELSKLKSIWFIVHATGDSDIYTEFVAKSLDELNDLIFNKVYKINGVVRTETSLILKYLKRRYDWGTALP
jgi:Lrp/AsnC family transcriptional regulator for asnA, asnC and gidA